MQNKRITLCLSQSKVIAIKDDFGKAMNSKLQVDISRVAHVRLLQKIDFPVLEVAKLLS